MYPKGGKKVTSVKLTRWYLENWEYGLKTRTSRSI